MKHIVGFSGGVASSVVAKIVAGKHPKNTILLFHDTKTEPEDNYRFRKQVASYIGLPITNDSDGRDIWQVFDDEGILGNSRETPCSRILKQERSMAFVIKNQPAILYIGFTPDEYLRAQRTYARYAQKDVEVKFPLIEARISKNECFHKITDCWQILLPDMYKWANHANCIPCIKGKKAYWGLIYKNAREEFDRAVLYEEKFGHTIMAEGGLLELLPECLELAKKHKKWEMQELLFEFPCDCAV